MKYIDLLKDNFTASSAITAVRKFFVSKQFMLICLLFGVITTVAGIEFYSIIILGLTIGIIAFICDELIATLMPFLTLCCVAIKCFDSFDLYINYVWVGVIAVVGVAAHFILYRKKPKAGSLLASSVAVTAAVMLGGVGKISAAEYFSLTSIYYMLGLGIVMVIVYVIFSSCYTSEKIDVRETTAYVMYLICILSCLMVISYYIMNIKKVISSGCVLEPQWRNNVSTFIMLTMPFAFYLSIKRPVCLVTALAAMPCLMLTSSRGGLLFGSVEFVLCCVYLISMDKKKRRINMALIALMLIAVIFFADEISGFIAKTLVRFEHIANEPRMGLANRAVEDFKSNPLFGRGIGYMGNRDIHPSKKFAACWYHSSPFQVIGSFGLVGVAAFGWQIIARCKVLAERISKFNAAVALAYIGIVMMSLVNPGEFSPLPYEFMTVMLFALAEQEEKKKHSFNLKIHK